MDPFVGEIRIFGGTYAPVNWAMCWGQLLTIGDYDQLYSLIGTTYGGDGRSNFALPDLRGRIPVHSGTGPGLTTKLIGWRYGTERETLTTGQIPSHNHPFNVVNTPAQSDAPAGKMVAEPDKALFAPPSDPTKIVQMNEDMIASAGGNQPHENMMPFLSVNFIISLRGLYPQRP